jgi:hypothetical protein
MPSAPLAPIPSLREVAPALDADLIAAIDRAVSLEHERRPTAAELAAMLDRAPATETVFVPDEPRRKPRWKPFVLAGTGVALLGTAIVIGTMRSQTRAHHVADAAVVPVSADAGVVDAVEIDALDLDAAIDARPPIVDPPPGQLRIVTPPMPDPEAAKEWRKLVDKLYEHKFDEGRAKLDDWERKWGATEETMSVRRQIDAMPRRNDDD